MPIIISDILKSEFAIFHSEGLIINNLIEMEIKKKKPVTISFKGLEKCSTQFLNAAIGKLYLNHKESKLKKLIHFEKETSIPMLKEKISDVIENAIHPIVNHSNSSDSNFLFV